jgi:hypothetical protein
MPYLRHCRDHAALFVDLRQGGIRDTSGHDHDTCPGYLNHHKMNGLEYLFSDRKFEEVAGGPAHAKRLKEELAREGRIAVEAGGGGVARCSVPRMIGRTAKGKLDRRQVIAIRAVPSA